MRKTRAISKLAVAGLFAGGLSLHAQNLVTWNSGDGDFFDPARWDAAAIPGLTDIAVINNGSTATIGTTAGEHALGGIRLGDVDAGTESGHIIMNGGTLRIGATPADPNQVLIGLSTVESTFIMNGGTIFLDAPETGLLNTAFKGANEIDWEVGLRGLGRFEMHGDSAFYASDDLKVGENALGGGTVLIDGNARVGLGSGISVSSGGGTVEQSLVIGGNAVVDSGNSMGAGNPLGGTDEGYLTLAISEGLAKVTVQENAILNIRRLSAREGTSTMIVKDNAQFHIFDVLNGAGTNAASRPPELGPNSTFGSAPTSLGTFTLQDDAVMTVNSAPESGPTRGLGISAQRDLGNGGGKMTMTVRDRASLTIEQDLMLGTGADAETSDGTFEVIGPDASITINGNLNMAVDLDGNIAALDDIGNIVPGVSTLKAVITGPEHSTINLGGIARLTYGRLKVVLNGHTPVSGASYTLIDGGTIEGNFASTDYSEAILPQGLGWQVEYNADSVVLKVAEAPGLPGAPSANGVTTNSPTIYVNPPDTVNNGNTESLGVAIAHNGNVIVGWEDDADEDTSLQYLGAAWTMFSSNGVPVTEPTVQNSVAVGGSTTSRFLSYFRADDTAIPAFTSWGPKIKANQFGEGVGMGATSYALGMEVPEFAAIENNAAGENAGDYPTVQLLDSTGAPIGIVSGVNDPYAERDGNIRIGDWEFLSNGNILVVGESRQNADLVDVYAGSNPDMHVIYRIVAQNGTEVKAASLASETSEGRSEMWHGSAVARDGFALRFNLNSRAVMRLFNNDGTPASANIDIADLTGHLITSGGGRGDGIGFHGNGKDAYALINIGADDLGANAVWVTVFNTNGTVRYSKSIATDVVLSSVASSRADIAIDESGRVFAAWDAAVPVDDGSGVPVDVRIVMGRLLDPEGNPLGGTFYISENEQPVTTTLNANGPRVAMRNNIAAVTWESLNAGVEQSVVALRIFGIPSGSSGSDVELAVERIATGLRLSWTGGSAPYTIERKASLDDANWTTVTTTSNTSAEVTTEGAQGFFRISSGTP